MQIGLEVLPQRPLARLQGARLALLTHRAAVDESFRPAHEVIAQTFPGQLRALFTPQHGLWGAEQDNMIETPHSRHSKLGIPVHSLYAESRKPSPQSLEDIDYLLVELQDVGTRVYTYLWTLTYCLEACAERGIPVVVLDRPNPLGGERVEGRCLELEYSSFVGRAALPMRHGLTLGELALYTNHALACGAEVDVVPMEGWQRPQGFPPARSWVPPSPNLPRLEGVRSYPGTVLFEGTTFSEGRGTTTPFEVVGAPAVDPWVWRESTSGAELRGVRLEPVYFTPTFHKFQGERCGGLVLQVTSQEYRPYHTALVLLDAARRLYGAALGWRDPPYEYEHSRLPIDLIAGGPDLRQAVDRGLTPETLRDLCEPPQSRWCREVEPFLLYPPTT
jgi:uncharacterized protein YbbC (DUF1343 family)